MCDDEGRKQYRDPRDGRAIRSATRCGRLADFGRALPRIRARVTADLELEGTSRERVLAAVVQLLEVLERITGS